MSQFVTVSQLRQAGKLVNNPYSGHKNAQYKSLQRKYHDALVLAGVDPDVIDPSKERKDYKDPSKLALGL